MSDWLKQFEEKMMADAAAKLAAQQARWNASPEEKKAAQKAKNESWQARNLPRLRAAKAAEIARKGARIEQIRNYKNKKSEVVVEEQAIEVKEEVKKEKDASFLVPAGVYFVGDVYRGKEVASVSKARRVVQDDEFGADVGGSDYVQYVTLK